MPGDLRAGRGSELSIIPPVESEDDDAASSLSVGEQETYRGRNGDSCRSNQGPSGEHSYTSQPSNSHHRRSSHYAPTTRGTNRTEASNSNNSSGSGLWFAITSVLTACMMINMSAPTKASKKSRDTTESSGRRRPREQDNKTHRSRNHSRKGAGSHHHTSKRRNTRQRSTSRPRGDEDRRARRRPSQ
jgi:hypothetical protein